MPKVLLVEDDFTMVSLLKTLLVMEKYEVETLLDKSGDVLENIQKINPDFLLVDVFLGYRNGLDLVRELRNQPKLNPIRVIMVSGINMSSECLSAGANAFLLKPFMPDELMNVLRSQGDADVRSTNP